LPGTVASTAQRKQSGVTDGRQAASVPARAALDGENAVIRWRGQQDRLPARCIHSVFAASEARRRQGWRPARGKTCASKAWCAARQRDRPGVWMVCLYETGTQNVV